MKILIERQLTRRERVLLLMQAIEEAEAHGFAEVNVKIHNHQISTLNLEKANQFGNCSDEWYNAS